MPLAKFSQSKHLPLLSVYIIIGVVSTKRDDLANTNFLKYKDPERQKEQKKQLRDLNLSLNTYFIENKKNRF